MAFLPYIGEHFAKQYIVPLYIGESVSSSIPSLIVFFQGSSSPDESQCEKEKKSVQLPAITKEEDTFLEISKKQYFVHQKENTINSANASSYIETAKETLKTDPFFSVSVFFFIIAGLMLICTLTFIYVDFKYARSKKLKKEIKLKPLKMFREEEAFIDDLNETEISNRKKKDENHSVEKTILLLISFFISCFMYGILPGIQPYSTLPYGYAPFHLSINLGNLLLPIAVFSSIFSKKDSMRSIILQFSLGLLFSLYLLFISIMSPCPPFVMSHPNFGAFMAVFAWILIECVFIRLLCKIAERFERFGGEAFLFLGFATLLGQVIGGTTIYICVDIYRLFLDKPPCVSDFSYCQL